MLQYRSLKFEQWFNIVFTVILGILFIFLPSISSNELIQGTMSGKMFFFLYLILAAGIILSLKNIVKFPVCISYNCVDISLSLLVIYMIINNYLKNIPVTNRVLEFFGLILLYILLRHIKYSRYFIILAAVVIGAVIQSIYGNFQLWGYLSSNHVVSKMTGSFFNSGPFVGYLITAFPIILGLLLFEKKSFSIAIVKIVRPIAWLGLFFILLTLFSAGSRAAYLALTISSVLLLVKRYSVIKWFNTYTIIKRVFLLISLAVFIGIVFEGIVRMKIDSANGRLLIWKVSSGIVRENPLTGVGFDCFKSYYMDKQADYFRQNPNSPEIMVAGDTNYCFNEFLQHTIENGLIGLIFLLVVIISIFGTKNELFEIELWIAKAGIVSIVIFAMFSYPAQILPIKINLVCYLAYISILSGKQIQWNPRKMKNSLRCILVVVAIGGCFVFTKSLPAYYKVWKNWGLADRQYKLKNYSVSIDEYKKAWPLLKDNGDYLTHYGKVLAMSGEYEKAVTVLRQAAIYYPNIIVYTTLGDSYKPLGRFEDAEQAYLSAWYMNPSRFYPKYLLAKLYDETDQEEKAIIIAKELLHKKVKIESTAIREIKEEMQSILNKSLKYNGR